MSDEELAKIKGQIERRWKEKGVGDFDPHGPDTYNSPGCMMRAHEILRMIARVELSEPTRGTTT
jgi:hypothetical protein